MNKYNIIHFDTIDSTNDYLKKNYAKFSEYTVVESNIQVKGKGRIGHNWESTSDTLAFSILLKPIKENISILTLLAGVSVFNTINKYFKCMIKWPNDILINDKKICGILAEAVISNKVEALIIGIGINISQTHFDGELYSKATSLKIENNKNLYIDFNKKDILKEVLENFDILYSKYLKNDYSFIDIVKKNNYLKDKIGYIDNEKVEIKDIDDDGNLIVKKSDNSIKHIHSGEVSLTNFYQS